MTKFNGVVGYAELAETSPGVWQEVMTEKRYFGDILKNTRRLQEGEKVNDDLTISNSFSILADAYAHQHFFAMRYVEWAGARWKITNVEVKSPRLILTVGGVYNDNASGDTGTP